MKASARMRAILLAAALVAVLLVPVGISGHWWTRLTARPPGPMQTYVCSNARCRRQFQAEVGAGHEVRCPECKWLARPAPPR